MYHALNPDLWIKVVAGTGAIVFLVLWWFVPPDSWTAWAGHFSNTIALTALIAVAIGNRWVFCWLWRYRGIERVFFPYIAGDWVGSISSNWLVVDAMRNAFVEGCSEHDPSELDVQRLGMKDKQVKVTVTADLFRIVLKLETTDEYSTSHTIVVRPDRNGPVPRLFYIYKNETAVPDNTDSEAHFGAAVLNIYQEDGETTLKGLYWTARNWTKGLNTAGRIELNRTQR